jgi:hypothetical protein
MIEKVSCLATNAGIGTIANAVASLQLKVGKDLSSCGTYKVKIKRRQFKSSDSNTPAKRNLINQKSLSFDGSLKVQISSNDEPDYFLGSLKRSNSNNLLDDASLSSNSVLLSIVSASSLADQQNQQKNGQVRSCPI